MVRIGLIGLGFMGFTHFEGSQKLKGAKLVAIAESNKKRLSGDWTDIQGNFGPRGGKVDLSKYKTYEDYHDLLNDPDIDLVDICVPTGFHEQVVLDAVKAGKDILCEKPIAIDLKSAKKMVSAAQKAKTRFMVAHVLPFFPEFRFAADAIHSGKYGKLLGAHFKRVITPPTWSAGMADFRKLGGWGIDLHVHDNHFISHVCGVPKKVFSRGLVQDGFVNHVHTEYVYDDPDLAVSCVSGGIATKGLEFAHGFELYLEKATIIYEAGTIGGEFVVDRPLTLMTHTGRTTQPKLKGGSEWYAAYKSEIQKAVDVINKGDDPGPLDGALALDALKLCYAENKSITTGRLVPIK